jgi:DNA-binding transcriptional MocR family regulator
MTMWLPRLQAGSGPRYLAIAEALAGDVRAGRLVPGARLPTHRELAHRLGVTVGTVSRAYGEAERRGLIAAHVGRGTYVAETGPGSGRGERPGEHALDAIYRPRGDGGGLGDGVGESLDLSLNYPHTPSLTAGLAAGLAGLTRLDETNLAGIGSYQPPSGMPAHRSAAARWLERLGIAADPEDIVIVPGCQGGLLAAFMALARAGETVLTEALTWPGMRAATTPLGLRVQPVAMDAEGLRPDALEAACRAHRPRLLYTMTSLHNPTCIVMPEPRRREIAAIARAHELFVIEDDVYGFLLDDRPPPLRTFLPELGLYVTSLSKSVAPGLRVGYLWAPAALRSRLAGAVRANVLMTSPVTAELASQLILSGAAVEAAERQRTQARRRQRMATERLAGLAVSTHPASFHLWLRVPPAWRPGELTARLADRGVAVTPGEAFAGDPSVEEAHGHVRLCLCAIGSDERFARAIDIVAEVARGGSTGALPVV